MHEELARLHSSVSTFYLSVPNCLQYKKEIIGTMEQAVRYAQLAKNTTEYLSCLHDIAQVRSRSEGPHLFLRQICLSFQTLLLFEDYQGAKTFLLKIYRFKRDNLIKEKAIRDLGQW